MEAYSMDLRRRVMAAVENRKEAGESMTDVAKRFSVSRQWIYALQERWEKDKTLEPKLHAGGQVRKITPKLEEKLKARIEEKPDTTLKELLEMLGIVGTLMCIWRALKRLKITRKKSRCTPRNERTPR